MVLRTRTFRLPARGLGIQIKAFGRKANTTTAKFDTGWVKLEFEAVEVKDMNRGLGAGAALSMPIPLSVEKDSRDAQSVHHTAVGSSVHSFALL